MHRIHGHGNFLTGSPSLHVARTALLLALLAAQPAAADEEEAYPDAFEVCTSCHAYQEGEPKLVGPTLYHVYGRKIASVPGFDYSEALRKVSGTWDRESLNRWLTKPEEFAPGTKMTMGGLHDAKERKEVIDFLEKQSREQ